MKQQRIISYDMMNVVSCFAVVALHVNGTALSVFSVSRNWITSMIIETVFYFAVPIFLMLTGATLIDYRRRYDTHQFLRKRFQRTVIPFLFWSVMAIVFCITVLKVIPLSAVNGPAKLIDIIMNVKAFNIYYFFPNLFAIYLCIPVLSRIPEELRLGKRGIFTYLIGFSFVTISCLPLLCNLFHISWNTALQNPMASGFLMFVLLGYALVNIKFSKRQRIILYILGSIGWAVHYFFTIYFSFQAGELVSTFKGYTNVPTVFFAVAVFVWFREHDWNKHRKLSSLAAKLSGASLGVYLVHKYVQYIIVIWGASTSIHGIGELEELF